MRTRPLCHPVCARPPRRRRHRRGTENAVYGHRQWDYLSRSGARPTTLQHRAIPVYAGFMQISVGDLPCL